MIMIIHIGALYIPNFGLGNGFLPDDANLLPEPVDLPFKLFCGILFRPIFYKDVLRISIKKQKK